MCFANCSVLEANCSRTCASDRAYSLLVPCGSPLASAALIRVVKRVSSAVFWSTRRWRAYDQFLFRLQIGLGLGNVVQALLDQLVELRLGIGIGRPSARLSKFRLSQEAETFQDLRGKNRHNHLPPRTPPSEMSTFHFLRSLILFPAVFAAKTSTHSRVHFLPLPDREITVRSQHLDIQVLFRLHAVDLGTAGIIPVFQGKRITAAWSSPRPDRGSSRFRNGYIPRERLAPCRPCNPP